MDVWEFVGRYWDIGKTEWNIMGYIGILGYIRIHINGFNGIHMDRMG